MKPSLWLALLLTGAPLLRAADTESRLVQKHGLKVRVDGASDAVWKTLRAIVELQLSLVGDSSATPPLADDLAFFIRKEYLKLGYASANVLWMIKDGAAVLIVVEGQRETVGETIVTGTTVATAEEMRDYLLRPTKERLGAAGKAPPLVEAEINTGASLLQRLIQSRGYLAATVSPPEFVRNGTGPVTVRLTVTEGPQSSFGDVTIQGPLPAEAAAARQDTAALTGQPFSEVRVEEIRAKVEAKCQAAGHFAAAVIAEAAPLPSGGRVPVTLTVNPGPVYRVERVEAAPELSRGAKRIVHAGFSPAEGAVWSTAELQQMQRRVMDTGVFSQLEAEPVTLESREAALVLRLNGQEAPRRTLGIYGGFETVKGAILGLEWRHVNIFDSGDTMRVKAGWEAGGPEGSIRWINPALFNSPYTSDTELSAGTVSLYDYTHNAAKLRTALTRQWNPRFSAGIHAYVSSDTASSSALTDEELGPDQYEMMAFGGTAGWDQRDSPVLPHKGFITTMAIEAGMADITYLRHDFRFSWYQPLSDKWRIAASLQASAIVVPDGVARLPVDARLFNGGATTVRSFKEHELGQLSASGTPLGGTLMHAGSVEVSYEFMDNLELAFFADTGSLSREGDTLLAVPEDLRYALGLGLRYALPVGPLRVDYGYNPSRRSGEAAGALHVTFGFAF